MAKIPRGRPPLLCPWGGDCWVDKATGEPRDTQRVREGSLRARRAYERKRYWDPSTKVRKRRLQRSAKQSGRPPMPVQLKLDALHAWPPAEHAKQNPRVQTPENPIGTTINSINDHPWKDTPLPERQPREAVIGNGKGT